MNEAKAVSTTGATDLTALPAHEIVRLTTSGRARVAEVAEAHIAAIEAREPEIGAWTFFDPDYVRLQARLLDSRRERGLPLGPLHGVPVGLKDIIDTRDMPTENGTPIDAGRKPTQDATVVARLREAGAIILGKTVTTELAVLHPAGTRNPHDPSRTPGGSSSGSAAAVAANMAALALGTQTNGSVIRPASYCGVYGYKPTPGIVPRSGVLRCSGALDVVGGFARDISDVALLVDAIAGFDGHDSQVPPAGRPDLLATARSAPPVRPAFAFVKSPVWDEAAPDQKAGFEELVEALGPDIVVEVDLPEPFASGHDMQRTIMMTDIARNYGHYANHAPDQLSQTMRDMIEEGRRTLALDYTLALDWMDVLNAGLEKLFERFDAIITPAATGEAPVGLDSTGSPTFCTLWTYCGVPAVSLPILSGENAMPIGVQVVGRRGHDGRLLRTARWLIEHLRGAEEGGS